MTPGARHQKTIDILTEFWKGTMPLDRFLKKSFKEARYMGSSDRRFVFQLVYDLMRERQALLEGGASNAREEVLLFLACHNLTLNDLHTQWEGGAFRPGPLSAAEEALIHEFLKPSCLPVWAKANVPSWIYEKLSVGDSAWASLNKTAPIDIWVNPLKSTPADFSKQLLKEGYDFKVLPGLPQGLRGDKGTLLEKTPWYQQGFFEFQDAGAQHLCHAISLPSAGRILDLCAGAGGKSLVMAANASKDLRIMATDIKESRLERAAYRLKRAGLHQGVQLVPFQSWQSTGPFDGILIDAPCSGSGVWRRHPEGKWQLTPEKLRELTLIQSNLLQEASGCLKPGGWLAYATCSLFYEENQNVIECFLKEFPSFYQLHEYRWLPWAHGTDGFFLSLLSKR